MNPKNQLIDVQMINAIGIIFMKGIFYYDMFIHHNFVFEAKSLNQSLNKIMNTMNNKTEFLFSYVPILLSLNEKFEKIKDNLATPKNKATFKVITNQGMSNYADLFSRRFAIWIRRALNPGVIH